MAAKRAQNHPKMPSNASKEALEALGSLGVEGAIQTVLPDGPREHQTPRSALESTRRGPKSPLQRRFRASHTATRRPGATAHGDN